MQLNFIILVSNPYPSTDQQKFKIFVQFLVIFHH